MDSIFNLKGKIALITGGAGVLGSNFANVLAKQGVIVGIVSQSLQKAENTVQNIEKNGGQAFAVQANVLNKEEVEKVRDFIVEKYGRLDILINAAGGNMPGATIQPDQAVYDMKTEDLQQVIDLNIIGTMLPSQVFSALFAEQKQGNIINISSASAQRPLTRVVGYSASKAAIDNFTQWMAVELASKYGEGIRVNAISPGFFIGEQNRALLLTPEGNLTPRGEKIIGQTPMGRFGKPEDIDGALLYLCSDMSKFVTGTVLKVDGGFAAASI
ncbi:NAD(P)-dependent dehydrogenase, short-chain alcohol dehydrogenase family [Flavobacterium resistens]|uniref:NAD(P)-dependent dehydrogenase, short-chain alcohol dehydrogenase family n=1 Tax=Flavobacterium resistens TaxID=443612 RepID=A0A521F389_9FLAO|nr:SDR family oxidoreductase [Flavobacterium resistens]MRX69494.1 SDR family oxidoreductase [Flavobacterium resistens]SMO90623.1 NAD(P)-dependent dehydrogenase, short-chain alcohol dehydrogenase family [Flavobacterium resistens]